MAKLDETYTYNHNARERRQVNGLPLIYPYGATYKVSCNIIILKREIE